MTWLAALAHEMPWWAKIVGKVILARLPVSGETWQKVGLFSPGLMHRPDYAMAVFDKHFTAAGSPPQGFSFLELGPGDSIASAVVGHAYGAARGWLVDSGAYATRDMAFYGRLAGRLEAARPGSDLGPMKGSQSIAELLARSQITYLEQGLESLRQVPSGSCDFAFSEVVLEHLPLDQFDAVMAELHRIVKPGGTATHGVDFHDHLGGGWNNLRFSRRLWEAPWFARRSGFYTNRLRLAEIVARARTAGFDVEVRSTEHWSHPPLALEKLAPAFRDLGADDILTCYAHVVMRKPVR